MKHPLITDRFRTRGIVLPVVLVMLLLMTVTVIFLMRRGTVDERIAFNVREVVSLDSAVQFALRTCEQMLWNSPPPPGTLPACAPGDSRSHCIARCADNADQPHCRPGCDTNPSQSFCTPRNMAGGTPTPAWRNTAFDGNWRPLGSNAADVLDLYGAGIVAARCLFEDATHELEIVREDVRPNPLETPPFTWRKYRITAEVEGRDAIVGRAQAEVRFPVGPS